MEGVAWVAQITLFLTLGLLVFPSQLGAVLVASAIGLLITPFFAQIIRQSSRRWSAMHEIAECRKAFPEDYIRVNAFDSTRGWESVRLSFIVNRPREEPGFRLVRTEAEGRMQRYSIERRK